MSQYNPLVTIVIPVYNGNNFLKEAIDCALAQTYENLEIIVVNDGSTDDGASEEIAKAYGDRIIYIWKENGGVSSALNVAIKEMKGDWLSWLSHDDLYYANKIAKQVEFIRKLMEKDPTVNLEKIAIHCATESIDKDGKVIKTPNYKDIPEKEDSIDVIIGNIYNYRLSGCSFLIPHAAFKNLGGFREDIRTVSDVEFWYRLLFNGYQFYCMSNDILVKNRSHGKQVGKIKVSLFEKELESLHVDIADQLCNSNEYNKTEYFIKMYYGLTKRHINGAARYVKEKYINNRVSAYDYNFRIPVRAFIWKVIGSLRNTARDIYRKIRVK
jgi:glycosyltransferase involved in cell wall biosynthesis